MLIPSINNSFETDWSSRADVKWYSILNGIPR
jgi:hypothetical protein